MSVSSTKLSQDFRSLNRESVRQIVGTLNDISHVFARPASSTEQCCTEADAIFRK